MKPMFGALRKKIASFFKKEEQVIEEKLEQPMETPIETKEQIKTTIVKKQEEIISEIKQEQPIYEKPVEQPKEKKFFLFSKKEKSKEAIVEKKQETKEAIVEKQKPIILKQPEPTKPEPEKEKIKVTQEQPKHEKEFAPKLSLMTQIKKAITRKATVSEKDVTSLLWDFNLELLESDVSVLVAEKICAEIKENLVGKEFSSKDSVKEITHSAIKKAIEDSVIESDFNFIDKVKSKKPFVILFVGPNGHGKSTTIGKLSYYLKKNNLTSVLVAADTFRAAAIEQLEKIGEKAGIKVIKHNYGSDPAAVAFDGIKHAESKGLDIVLIDTAGRSELNTNLMEQLRKIVKVSKPDLKIYIGEALAGNAAVEEAKKFNDIINIDGVIMTKADCDVKGGAILSISYETKKPVLFIGIGQGLDDLKPFEKKWFIDKVFEE